MATNILWIEGSRNAAPAFVPELRRRGYLVETAPTGKAALARIPSLEPDLVVVNVASLRTNGRRVCQALRDRREDLPVLLICEEVDRSVDASQILVLPFTLRKLLNRVRALVPEQGGKVLKAGLITFYPDCNSIQCRDMSCRDLSLTCSLT